MSILKVLKKSLPPELFAQVEEQLGDESDLEYVPKSRLDRVVAQRNSYRDQLSVLQDGDPVGDDGTPPKANPKPKADPDPKTPPAGGDDKIKEQYEARIAEMERNFAVQGALMAARAKDPALVLSSLDLKEVKLGEDGKWTGIDEAIAARKTSHPYMFDDGQPSPNPAAPPAGTGRAGQGGRGELPDANLTDEEYFKKVMGG